MGSGSGSGLNRVNATILSVNASAAAVSSPLSAYGTIGVNDSGMALNEARDFKKWNFSLSGGGTGYEISVYGTNDPIAYAAWRQAFNPGYYPGGVVVLPATSWFLLPGPDQEAGTGPMANPMTQTAPMMEFSGSILACRAVLTATSGAAGVVNVNVEVQG